MEKKIGYKGFNYKEGKYYCRDVQYEIGSSYEVEGEIEICNTGIHYCDRIEDVLDYYTMGENTRICLVEDIGDKRIIEGNKSVTNRIKIVEDVTNRLYDVNQNIKYDEKGNMIYKKDCYGREYRWDEKGNIIYKKDWDGYEYRWEYRYDERGNKIYEKDCSGNEYRWKYKYDEKGNVIYEKDCKGREYRWEYRYDERGNKIYEKDCYGNEYKYDEKGNMIYKKDNKEVFRKI